MLFFCLPPSLLPSSFFIKENLPPVLAFYAAVTNYHQLRCLKQHKLIISQFWRSEIQNVSAGQNQHVGRTVFLLEALGRNLYPFPASKVHPHSLVKHSQVPGLGCGHLQGASFCYHTASITECCWARGGGRAGIGQ